ncbi:MAG: hypothetical protein Q8M20_18000 [Rhodocyclaceae bacterium]|nr:hypothetical protein [Rhodocyclaceae bacterium]
MKLTKAQADKIKDSVSGRYGSVYLRCDNYLVTGKVEQYRTRLVIAVFVNGYQKGTDIWTGKEGDFSEMPELTKRFYYRRKHPVNTKEQATLLKILGKKAFNEKRYGEAWYTCIPWFNSPAGFVNHLKKHNESIQVLDYETYQGELNAIEEGDANAA